MINDKLKQVADLMQECVKAGKMEWKNLQTGNWYEWRGDNMPNISMFENGTIRPHDPLREIKEAFARGETVEVLTELGWKKPDFIESWHIKPEFYRIAPKRWYRVAEFEYCTSTANIESDEKEFESDKEFVRWLTERVYY